MILEVDEPEDANVISVPFVITIKDIETETPIVKARFVAHGNKYFEKKQLTHNSTTARQSSVGLLAAFAVIMRFDVWNEGIWQAYLQSANELLHEIQLRPTHYLHESAENVLKLPRPLYWLADSGDYWQATFSKKFQMN